jgi:pilus assembly protein CpaB
MKFNLPKSTASKKTLIVLGTALVIGLVAAWIAKNYLTSQMEAIEARNKGQIVEVVVAKKNIKPATVLREEHISIRKIPAEFWHANAIHPRDFSKIQGRVLDYPVGEDQMILWGLLQTKKAPTFSSVVQPGRRAMTVPVDEINSISGMLEPADKIDLLLSVSNEGKKTVLPLLQNVSVMATGQQAIDNPQTGERRQFSTVTLDITTEQAKNVIIAREVGKLTALLRNPADQEVVSRTAQDLSALLGGSRKANTAVAEAVTAAERKIPVLYGGSGNKFSSEDLNLFGGPTPVRPSSESLQLTDEQRRKVIQTLLNPTGTPSVPTTTTPSPSNTTRPSYETTNLPR